MLSHNRSPIASLLALAALSAVLNAPTAKPRTVSEPAPQPDSPAGAPTLDELLNVVFGKQAAPASSPIAQVCAIPPDIADRCGMSNPGFDPHSMVGRTVVLLAAALANLREIRGNCELSEAAKCQMADQNIGAAIAALDLLELASTAMPETRVEMPTTTA